MEPITGALVVSTLPAATLLARSLGRGLSPWASVWGGAALLAAGLVALALLPRVSNALVALALAFCGIGLGLAAPVLTRASLDADAGIVRSGAITVSARHAGLVLGLALVAPLLTGSLDKAGERALLGGTETILDANVPIRKKVPIALALRDALENAQKGEVPDLGKPFDDAGAQSNENVRRARDDLVNTLESALTRGFPLVVCARRTVRRAGRRAGLAAAEGVVKILAVLLGAALALIVVELSVGLSASGNRSSPSRAGTSPRSRAAGWTGRCSASRSAA